MRLRIDLVAKFIKAVRPDILCLQETKCPDDAFPLKRFKRLGYEHVALNGQKGYHGVVVLSRLPFESNAIQVFCGKSDCRHVSIVLGERAGLRDPITLHNFYVPAGGDIPDPAVNAKFAHKLAFLDEMRGSAALRPARSRAQRSWSATSTWRRSNATFGATSSCLRVVSHTPIECEKLLGVQKAGGWIDTVRALRAGAGKALHLVELPFAGLGRSRQGPPAGSHLDVAAARRPRLWRKSVEGFPRLGAAVGSCAGDGDAGALAAALAETVCSRMRPAVAIE